MQRKNLPSFLAAAFFLAAALNLSAQGTAIFYQGRLDDSGAPANTNYDLRFAVFTAPTGGTNVSVWLTNSAVPVANGLFTVTLDFGPGVFNGTANGSNDWLDIAVRAIGATNFTPLTPRQPVLPVPYALFATSASNLLGSLQSTQLLGRISSSLIAGTYSNSVNFSNSTNVFAGTFSGNGAGLASLNASQITSGTLADARLSGNVPLLNTNQTFTGTNTFTGPGTFTGNNFFAGVNTFTNFGNAFSGSFFGNGLVGWIPVYSTATNAQRDHGYLLLNSGLTTVTLPASASLAVDDIVRVAGGGAGGWLVQENSGQSIAGNFAAYRDSYVVPLPVTGTGYHGVAAAADGTRMYAVSTDFTGVYASSDGGQTWSQIGATYISGYCYYVACSANGKTVYVEPTSGTIQKSTNGGLTWSSTGVAATANFISCTADGNTLLTGNVACSGNGTYLAGLSGGVIYYSTNGSSSWIAISGPGGSVNCLATSSDCTRLVAGVNNGLLYASSNQGATWTALTTTNQYWSSAWMSPDGSKLAATASKNGTIDGGIFSCAVSTLPNTVSTNSTICGSQGSAVELQYLGNGQFMPVSSSGLLWAN